jgi:hypothetical protein
MSGQVYQWRPGAGIKVGAKVAGQRLEELRETHGGKLSPAAVVEDARSRVSPLHRAFQWDDSKAAKEHRLWQARHLINSLIVVVKGGNSPESQRPKRAFVSVVRNKSRSYTARASALSEEDLRRQMVEQAIRELLSWRSRHGDLDELARVHRVIDAMARKFGLTNGRKKSAA